MPTTHVKTLCLVRDSHIPKLRHDVEVRAHYPKEGARALTNRENESFTFETYVGFTRMITLAGSCRSGKCIH